MSYISSGRQFFLFCVVALWSVVTLWWMELRESVLFSFGINLFFIKQILIMLYVTTEYFVFFPKSSSKISNILESACKSTSLLIFSKISTSAEKSPHLGTLATCFQELRDETRTGRECDKPVTNNSREVCETQKTCEIEHVCMVYFVLCMLLHKTNFSFLASRTILW